MLGMCRIIIRSFSTNLGAGLQYPQVCVVGSGPAGFYTAQQILKSHPTAQVDIYEKLPVPFGLIRYGVAPDHPEVKNCIHTFNQAAKNERLSFLGNIAVGKDVSLSQLKEAYHAIVLAYGAAKDRMLNIPGENLPNVLPARKFVGWYNGSPEDCELDVDLNIEDVAVIGHGNVALDIARILLTSVDLLKTTDIPEPVLEKLSKSHIKRVHLIGRRRAQDVSFTIKELREMINLQHCRPILRKEDFQDLPPLITDSPRHKKRLLELLYKTALGEPSELQRQNWMNADREWMLRFLLSPLEIVPGNAAGQSLKGIRFGRNRVENGKAISTGETEFLECGLVLRSIGYTGFTIDSSIPFDFDRGLIPNESGRVDGHEGLYVSGWVATGPVGVILTTMQSGFSTGKTIISHMRSGVIDVGQQKEGKGSVIKILAKKKIRPVTFSDWSHLDKYEVEQGSKYGKPREKITSLTKIQEVSGMTSR